MRLAYISDQRFFSWGNQWYTTASFPLDALHELFPFVDEWLIYGRLYELTKEPDDLYVIPMPPASKVTFRGPYGMRRGLRGYLGGSLRYLYGAYRAIVSSDIVWLKLPFVASLASLAAPSRDRLVFAQMIGDPREATAEHGTSVRVPASLYAQVVRRILMKSTFSVFVSYDLARKYHVPNVPWFVANESRITDKMLRSSANVEVHPIVRILYVGRLSPEKGLPTLFSALTIMKKSISVEAWIVGSGDQKGVLTALANDLGIAADVKFIGQVPWGERLFSIMRECDVLVLPSKSEGLGLVLIEAMSQGLPVVATAVGGIPEVVQDGVTGLLVSAGSASDLAAALTQAISDATLRASLISAGFEVARQNTLTKQTGRIAGEVGRWLVQRETDRPLSSEGLH